jgi:hypothetical protein
MDKKAEGVPDKEALYKIKLVIPFFFFGITCRKQFDFKNNVPVIFSLQKNKNKKSAST